MKRRGKNQLFLRGKKKASPRSWFHPRWNKLNENLAPSLDLFLAPPSRLKMCCFISQFFYFSEQDTVLDSVWLGKCGRREGLWFFSFFPFFFTIYFFVFYNFGGRLSLLSSKINDCYLKENDEILSTLFSVIKTQQINNPTEAIL